MGPLELVFTASSSSSSTPSSPASPPQPLPLPPLLPSGPGAGGHVVLGTGAAVGITGIRSARLARPLDLPVPTPGFMAGVWGRAAGAAAPATLGDLDGRRPRSVYYFVTWLCTRRACGVALWAPPRMRRSASRAVGYSHVVSLASDPSRMHCVANEGGVCPLLLHDLLDSSYVTLFLASTCHFLESTCNSRRSKVHADRCCPGQV